MNEFLSPPLLAAALGSAVSFFVSWLFRRDNTARRDATETARIVELERRLGTVEKEMVSKRDLDFLTAQLSEIRLDVREIRNGMDVPRK